MSKLPRVWLSCLLFIAAALGMMLPAQAADTKPLIAVLPFDDGSIKHWWWNDWDVGKGVSDLIINAIFETGKFRVVERQKLDAIIAEQNLGASGRVDQRSAAQIGKLLGAKYFIMGKVTEFTIAPDTGEVLDVVTDVICEITIGEVKDKSCNGAITKKIAADPTPKAGDLAKLKK